MELTAEKIAEIAAQAATEAVNKLKEPVSKFKPGDNADPNEETKVVKDATDKLTEDPKGGFKSVGHYFRDIINAGSPQGRESEHLHKWSSAVKAVMQEGDLAQGGYLVPEEFRATLLQTSLEGSIVGGRAVRIPMATNRITIPALVDSNHATNFFGGITIYRTEEAATKTVTKPAFGTVGLTLHKLTGLAQVTDELIQDSPISIEPIVRSVFGQAIAFVQDDDFLNGNGANMALGAFNAGNPSLVAVAKEPGQAAATILWQNIVNMWARLYPAGQMKAIWVANIECFPQLASMAFAVGAGGIPVWMPAGGVSGSPYATLMGRPLLFTEKMQALGTQGDIGLADFSQYLVGEKAGGVQVATSMHVYFVYDEMAFRFVLRYDGQPWWLSALTPRRGTATLSPFVVLAVRA